MRVVFVIAPNNFRDEELFHTKEEVESAGIETKIASIKKGEIKGSQGGSADSEMLISEINVGDFDAVVFPGGSGVLENKTYENEEYLNIAKKFYESGKLVAAICAGPMILARAGLLKGKKATCFPDESIINTLKEEGADYTAEEVEKDGKIITGNGPGAAHKFGKTIAEELLHR